MTSDDARRTISIPPRLPPPGGARDPAQPALRRLCFMASPASAAQEGLHRLVELYGSAEPAEADAIVVLGGDGFMLATLHRFLRTGIPLYGMNCGSVGFLMNDFEEQDLVERVSTARKAVLHPLRMMATTEDGGSLDALAINEVSLLRQTQQAAKIRITIDGVVRLPELACDGIMVATPAGSTAYNLSAHGPIIPVGAALLALTPVSAFRPRRWRGALLASTARVTFEILERWKRPVSAVADDAEVRNVVRVDVVEDTGVALELLFDAHHGLEERILREQFTM